MFWGLIMEPGRRYSQKVKKSFRVTMAAIDVSTSENDPCQVMCGYGGRNYLLCTLKKPDLLQCALDLEFASDSEVSFASNGNGHIHLTGYLIDVEDEDGLSLADLEEQEEEELVEDDSTKKSDIKKRNKKENAEAPPSKKARLLNGSVEEEESDDPDFEEDEAEAESGEEEASDEEEPGEEEELDESSEDVEEEEVQKQQEIKQKSNKKQQEGLKVNGDHKKDKKAQPTKQKALSKGVIIEDLVEGSGAVAKPGRYINVYYEGRLNKNNKVFDSMNKGPGFKFRLGGGEVIKAWDIGVTGMKVGGKRKIICPPHTAYGAKGSPPAIPPSSTLVFTVELKKVN